MKSKTLFLLLLASAMGLAQGIHRSSAALTSSQGIIAGILPGDGPGPDASSAAQSAAGAAESQLGEKADPNVLSAGSQVATMDTIRASAPVSVKLYGAKGDGHTDDTHAIQNALKAIASSHSGLYFPCGTYITSAQLTYTVPVSQGPTGGLYGEQSNCAIIEYTGSATITAVLQVTTGVSGASYFFDFAIKNLSIFGNANVTYDLDLTRPAHINFEKVQMWGANSTNGACLYVYSGVGGTYNQPTCDGTTSQGIPSPPFNGLVWDGANSQDQSTTSTIISPIVETLYGYAGGTGGTGIWLKNASLMIVTGCQVALTTQGLSIGTSGGPAPAQNTISNCLFENEMVASYVGGYSNKIQGGTFSGYHGSPSGGSLNIGGRQNSVSEAEIAGTTTVLSTASYALLDNDLFGSGNLVDHGLGTKMRNGTDDNGGYNIGNAQEMDNTASSPTNSSAGVNGVETLRGQWTFSTGITRLSPTVFATGKSWRAIFLGKFGLSGASCTRCESSPAFTELTETENTVAAPDSAVLAFAVNSNGIFSATGGRGGETYQGTILFMPDTTGATSGANSMKLAGSIAFGGGAAIPSSNDLCQSNGRNCPGTGNGFSQGVSSPDGKAGGGSSSGGSLGRNNLSLGAGAGAGANVSIVGTDGNHLVHIVTGSSPAAGAALWTINFTASRGHASYCVVSQAGTTGYSSISQSVLVAAFGPTSYAVNSGAAPLAAHTSYLWTVSCP